MVVKPAPAMNEVGNVTRPTMARVAHHVREVQLRTSDRKVIERLNSTVLHGIPAIWASQISVVILRNP